MQAANQVSIGNSITSLRFLNSTDWRKFVESHSVVEKTLRDDPARVYPEMDFATRDDYRHAIEEIARGSDLSEQEVAAKAIQLAAMTRGDTQEKRRQHVGYYLIDGGRPALERLVQMRLSPMIVASKLGHRLPLFFYLGAIALVTLATLFALGDWLHRHGIGRLMLLSVSALAAVSASQLGVAIVNRLVTSWVSPKRLPRLDFKNGIPVVCRTAVVVPTMLTGRAAIDEMLDALEVRYLANREKHLHFALLTDFSDADQETLSTDADLLAEVRLGVENLAAKYEHDRRNIFYLFHRSRRWNSHEGAWMGYERKRGKLADFNAMLRGATDRFTTTFGDTAELTAVRYVITLDTDTLLPRDTARQLVGAMAHALNRPVISEVKGRVVAGYAILQPRVAQACREKTNLGLSAYLAAIRASTLTPA